MDDPFWLSQAQMARIERHVPLSHGIARVADRRVSSGIVHVIRAGMRWRPLRMATGEDDALWRGVANVSPSKIGVREG